MEAPQSGDQSTQLADTRPQYDTPLRVGIPVNAPQRNVRSSVEKLIRESIFSPSAFQLNKSNLREPNAVGEHAPNVDIESEKKLPVVNMQHDAQIKTAIKDFSVLAYSSKRAEKKDQEAIGYVSLGVIHDNQCNYQSAIENYKLYLQLCEQQGDLTGTACACNCIGVDFMLMACPQTESGIVKGVILNSSTIEYINIAVEYHSKHLTIGPDDGGRFVANINIGLCLAMAGNITLAAKHYQDALRIAIKMQTLYGQSIAVGNLGNLALIKNDILTGKTCFEQHLQLVQALGDSEAEVKAWKVLSQIKYDEGDITGSIDCLEQSKKIALKEHYFNELRRVHCHIGLAKGNLEFEEYAQVISQQTSL